MAQKFREANLHITTGSAFCVSCEMTQELAREFVHDVLSPTLYEFGEGSYYSESEWSMVKGQWQSRLWDEETYARLLQIKQTWDPQHIFGCRHCVGDEEEPAFVSQRTLPSWRYKLQ